MVRALFVRQLRVRRIEGKLAVTLEDHQDASTRKTADANTPDHDLTRGELTALLDAAAGSRALLRYLAAVEHGLKRKDPMGLFLFDVELPRLRAALRQLDGLAPQQPSPGLSALRARIVDAIGAHEKRQREREMLMPRSDLMRGNKLEVAEARLSDFDRATEQWRAKDPAA